jgi:hypothetical protein
MQLPDNFIALLFAAAVIFVAGGVVFYAIVREPTRYFRLERVAFCYPLGLAALGMPMFLLSWAGVRMAVWHILLLVGAAAAAVFAIRRVPIPEFCAPKKDAEPRKSFTEFEWLLVAVIVACLGARTVACLLAPLNDWDGICIWGLKAKIFFFTTVHDTDFFQNQQNAFSMVVYPLLWPFMYTWVCTVLGKWDDLGMLILNPINMWVFAALLYCTAKKFTPRTVALAVTAMMASLPASMHYAETAQADIPIMLISGASLFCLFDWMQHRRTDSILLAAVLMGGALFTKNEGVIIFGAHLCAAILSIFLAGQTAERKKFAAQLGIYFAVAAAMAAPWFWFRRTITVYDWAHSGTGIGTMRWGEISTLAGIIVDNALKFHNAVQLPKWNILWPIFVAATAFSFTKIARHPWICLLFAFLLHAGGVAAVFLASRAPLTFQNLEIGFERYTLIMLPPIWMLLAYEANHFWQIWREGRKVAATPATSASAAR